MKRLSHPVIAWLLALAPLFGGDVARGSPPASSARAAAAVVRVYYAAIEARDYRRAYRCWENGGASSRQTYKAFAAGFRNTAHVRADVAAPGAIGAAAGSRYVEVPVIVTARTLDGKSQRFSGTYVLRRAMVDGATLEQRRWHIYSAKLRRVRAA